MLHTSGLGTRRSHILCYWFTAEQITSVILAHNMEEIFTPCLHTRSMHLHIKELKNSSRAIHPTSKLYQPKILWPGKNNLTSKIGFFFCHMLTAGKKTPSLGERYWETLKNTSINRTYMWQWKICYYDTSMLICCQRTCLLLNAYIPHWIMKL